MMRTDVAVVGLGAMGSAALWRLAERGVDVVGFEQFEPGHDQGSSHGESRIIRTAYFEGPQYVPLVQRSFELWRELEAATGEELLMMTGALMIGAPDSELIAGTLQSIQEHNLAHQVLDRVEMEKRYPQHRLLPSEMAIYEESAGVLRPERAVRAAARQAQARGASVFAHTHVDRVEVRSDLVRITAGDLVCEARHAVVSVGPWLGEFLPDLHLPVEVSRQVLSWFPLDDPEPFSVDLFPVFMHDSGDNLWYGFPTLDGRTIKLAIHQEGSATTADSVDRIIYPRDLEALEDRVVEELNGVRPEATHSLVCLYTNTPDFHFLLGPSPSSDSITILGGFSGHGFKFASVMGDIAADFAVNSGTDQPVELFALNRFAKGYSGT